MTSTWEYIIPRRAIVIAGQVAFEEARVADESEVGRETIAVGGQPRVEVDRARLLLALEDEPEVDRQLAARGQERLRRPQVEVELALVVGNAATEDPVADHDRLERR